MRKWLPAIVLLGIAAAVIPFLLSRQRRPAKSAQTPAIAAPAIEKASTRVVVQTNAVTQFTGNVTAASVPLKQKPAIAAPEPVLPPVVLPEPDVPEDQLLQLPAPAVLENVRLAFRNYQLKFGGNPVGTNLEITRALNGENPRQTRFLRMEDGMRVNARGELIDAWGTAYFFHQLSGTEMEIHSAGPDKKMWTADDLVIK